MSWLSCVWHFLVLLLLNNIVSWVRCGTRLYRFLIFAFSRTFNETSRGVFSLGIIFAAFCSKFVLVDFYMSCGMRVPTI